MEVEFDVRIDEMGKVQASWPTVIDKNWKDPWEKHGYDESKCEEDSNKKDSSPTAQAIDHNTQKQASTEAELPPGWQQVQSKSTGRYYYYNVKTGASQHDRP